LLASLGLSSPLRSYFAGNEAEKADELKTELEAGKAVALITDAGTPAIADPGLSAVRAARRVGAQISAIPGPSALTTALVISGFASDRFVFEGFLPRKGREREQRLAALAQEERTIVIFVGSAHLLVDLRDLSAMDPQREICIARELTKAFEEVQWLSASEAVEVWSERPTKGEFTLVVAGAPPTPVDMASAVDQVLQKIEDGEGMAGAVRQVANAQRLSRRDLYEEVLSRTRDTSFEP
jgi:16S rRNA (cytidine1402-2'-O)-methyltransferase